MPVRDRWLEGVAICDQCGVRLFEPGTKASPAQTAERGRTAVEGPAGATKSLMRAAWKLEGIAKLEKLAKWLEREHPDAADSLREGMEGMLHDQTNGYTSFATSLPGQHELD